MDRKARGNGLLLDPPIREGDPADHVAGLNERLARTPGPDPGVGPRRRTLRRSQDGAPALTPSPGPYTVAHVRQENRSQHGRG